MLEKKKRNKGVDLQPRDYLVLMGLFESRTMLRDQLLDAVIDKKEASHSRAQFLAVTSVDPDCTTHASPSHRYSG